MKNSKLLLLLLVLVMLSACGGKSKKTDFFEKEEPTAKPKVSNQSKLKRHWKVALGKAIKQGDAVISPAISGVDIYAASSNGNIKKVSSETGKVVWKSKLKKQTISAGVGVGSGLALVGTDQGKVYALNQTDGSIAWERQLSTEVLASPVVDGDVVVARAGDGKVYGMATYDGEILWTISRELPRLTLRGASKPLLLKGAAFIGFSDGTLAAVEAKSGRALWDFPISFARGTNEIDRLSDIDTTPLLVGTHIYVSSYQEITHALNIQEKRIDWSTDVSSFHALDYDAAHLYITDKKGAVHQLDRNAGKKNWSQTGLRLRSVSGPISLGDVVLVSEGDGGLYVLDKQSGEFIGRHKLGAKNIVGQPIVEDGVVYFIDTSGDLQAISIQR